MISRSAYAQLRYSPLLLAATIAMMVLTFIVPPLLAIFATGLPRFLGMRCLVGDDYFIHTDTCDFIGYRPFGVLPCRELPRFTCITLSIPRMTTCEGGAVSGRGAFTLMRRACNDPQWRVAIR